MIPNSYIDTPTLKKTLDNGGQQKQEVTKETEVAKKRERDRDSYDDNDTSYEEKSLQSILTNINKILKDLGAVNPTKKDVQEKIGDPTWNLHNNIDQNPYFENAIINTDEDLLFMSLGNARYPFNLKNAQNTIESGNFNSQLQQLKSVLKNLKKAVKKH
ncbi:hypothetical protein QIA36_00150 (plasmid) [Borreliella yangtzensis]|uniref:hypothetical protein n=1 Tax=Borreliella yangtzensis TaxID=683292 RepID=UPI002648C37C|nr:hypothetical protein [Borreliella yangtzensis]WKC74766.1 hypothetical protein QIA36_00150 [Borreliella yangtzensis]